ncbi:hypothetical protein B0T14DRAFT_567329 [Immersiella caudata]|uniref:Uncharacterized protein n=1 Tax=Immersiella caudata TaxID=314043 RepID=A0AA39WS53_9PEZI|nr:hypothetical protein B0T14DRAFT_567329 [Immersiella caudata]
MEVERDIESLASANNQASKTPSPSPANPTTTTLQTWQRPWLTTHGRFSDSRSRIRHFLGRLGDTWAWEFASMMLSLAGMTAIIAILKSYDGKAFPRMTGGISLNSLVATLSTLSKSSLIFSVSAYDGTPRPLDDVETFDRAGRGPLGATKLLLGRTARSVPESIGAIAITCALAVDPFVQQVVGSAQAESYVPSGPGNEAWTERQTRPAYFPRDQSRDRTPPMFGDPQRNYSDPDRANYLERLNGALWNEASVYGLQAHYPSGNCQVDSFETLEFCVDSAVVTDLENLYVNCNADASGSGPFGDHSWRFAAYQSGMMLGGSLFLPPPVSSHRIPRRSKLEPANDTPSARCIATR